MDHTKYKEYGLSQLYEALDTVDNVKYPGQLSAIEARIDELEGKTNKNKLEGIRGWLLLVALLIIITPIRIMITIITTYPGMFSLGIWDALTTQGSEAYSPLWAPILGMEMLLNCILVLFWLYVGYQFFTKRRIFPTWYIGVSVFSLLFVLADAFSINLALQGDTVFYPGMKMEIVRSLIMVAIWVPYMLISKRVKATFIR